MTQDHLSEEALLQAGYGIAGEDERRHAAGCAECASRVAALAARRAAASAAALDALPETFWLRQRHEILARARAQQLLTARVRVFALARVALAALSLALVLPPARVASVAPDPADELLFAEAFQAANGAPVRAVAPIALLIPAESVSKEKVRP